MTKRTSTFITLTLIALLGVCAIGEAQVDTWTQKADMPTARWLLSTNSPVVQYQRLPRRLHTIPKAWVKINKRTETAIGVAAMLMDGELR